ncbi:MAG: WD40 repeat domain-containing protein, partial [Nannocystaceae bacterium]
PVLPLAGELGSAMPPDALVGHADLKPLHHSPGESLLASQEAKVVVYSPDGTMLLSAGAGEGELPRGTDRLHIWNPATGTSSGSFGSPKATPSDLAWVGTPAWLVAAEVGSKVVVWEPKSRRELGSFEVGASVYALACAREKRICATGDDQNRIVLWDLENLKSRAQKAQSQDDGPAGARLTAPGALVAKPLWKADDPTFALALTRDGSKLIAPNLRGKKASLVVLDTNSGRVVNEFAIPGKVNSLRLSPDDSHLAVACSGPKGPVIMLYSLPDGTEQAQMHGHGSTVYGMGWLDDGKKLVSASSDSTVRIWTSTGKHLHTLTTDSIALWRMDIHPDGTQIAAAGNDRRIFVWETETFKRLFVGPEHHAARIEAVAWTADGNELLSMDVDGKVLAQRPTDGVVRASLSHDEKVYSLHMHPNGGSFLTASRSQVQLWDLKSMQPTSSFPSQPSADYRFNHDGTRLFRGDSTRLVQELDATTGKPSRTFGTPRPDDGMHQNLLRATSIALTPDGQHMAMARWDQPVAIYELKTGQRLRELPGTLEAAYRPDGKHLAVGKGIVSKRGNKLSVAIYDTTTWDQVAELQANPTGMRYTPDGNYLAVFQK